MLTACNVEGFTQILAQASNARIKTGPTLKTALQLRRGA